MQEAAGGIENENAGENEFEGMTDTSPETAGTSGYSEDAAQ